MIISKNKSNKPCYYINIVLIFYFLINTVLTYSQTDSLANKNCIVDFEKNQFDYLGIDSLNQKQGYWGIETEVLLLIERDTGIVLNCKEFGYYLDNKKEGIWNVYLIKNGSEIISHRFYMNDELLYEIQYYNKKPIAIVRRKTISRKNNQGETSINFVFDEIRFNKNGEVEYREYVTPEGLIQKDYYNR